MNDHLPLMNDRQISLALAVEWARDRGSVTGTHPGTSSVIEVAEEFCRFLIGDDSDDRR